jgi:succinate-semialdehyde dehydrogenase/glutarate-semialdehyde dehydrogenase
MGSSQHAPGILKQCFEAGKSAIADGAGNVWVYVDENNTPESAARILAQGATRYNGQTCTSINGALIHPAIYERVRHQLREYISEINTGNPLIENVNVGPLFDAAQAQWCVGQMQSSGGEIFGGECDGNYLKPAVIEEPSFDSAIIREGLFGPALWIAPCERDEFIRLWPRNKYPLCAGILSDEKPQWWLASLPNAARIVWNGDPSIEHIFEPWGGYPSSGANPVSIWHEKYTRVVSIDEAI